MEQTQISDNVYDHAWIYFLFCEYVGRTGNGSRTGLLGIYQSGAILGVYTGLLGYVGAETGLSLDLLSKRAFGEKGSYISSALTSFTQIGWFGAVIAMFAIPVAREFFGESTAVEWVLILIAGACMTASAYFGIK